jgi:hypothetical protein
MDPRYKKRAVATWALAAALLLALGSAGVQAQNGAWEWQNPLLQGHHLYGVWGSSGSDVFAVGDYTILHYDGADWSPMDSGATGWLGGVWGSSDSDVFAVGQRGTILHYDGEVWSPMDSPADELWDVWGSSGSDVFAVGFAGTILHYSGAPPKFYVYLPLVPKHPPYAEWLPSGSEYDAPAGPPASPVARRRTMQVPGFASPAAPTPQSPKRDQTAKEGAPTGTSGRSKKRSPPSSGDPPWQLLQTVLGELFLQDRRCLPRRFDVGRAV